ncbi:BRCA1-A complex subunit RAP80 [Conger conger]|uniref:BRCA1-A complex subunit RAP80 n=1 Tax=Conger conger TaxID=82655 RepID=UPI002A59EEFE|nr:BRCA1-A complex subunit RAP80 [Conger conger]
MVITAAQSGRRSLLPSPASPPNPTSPSSVQKRPTAVRPEGEASINPKKTSRPVKRKPVSRKRPQAPCWKKTRPAACEQSLSNSPPCSTAPPGASEDPETCCPLCGGYFSPEYLPQHASSCQGEEPDVELSFTPPYSPAHSSGGPAHSPALYAEQDLVPCPVCSFRFPSSQIHLHASSCGDPLEPQWSWVD